MRRWLALAAVVAAACSGRKDDKRVASSYEPPPEPAPTEVWTATPLPYPTPTSMFSRIAKDVKDVDAKVREKTTELMQLDDKVRNAIESISEEDERALGQATAVHVIGGSGGLVLEDVTLIRYVNRVGNSIAQQGTRKSKRVRSRDFVIGVLDDDQTINAFSTPGGYILLTSGLLRDLGSESELAWVLGHEIAHVDLEHGLEALEIYIGQQALAGSLTGRDHTPKWSDPGFFGKMAGTMASISDRVHGKREEREADALGLEYAIAAGYDTHGAARVLEMLADRTQTKLSPLTSHDAPYARRVALEDAMTAAKAKPGYVGKIGASRYTRDCIDRLDGIRAASR